jgi:hypothetical protein
VQSLVQADKSFKIRPSGEYPTSLLRTLYQYVVAMLCRLYGEHDASKFMLSLVPLIYYIVDIGSSFNWDDILSTSLEDSIRAAKETTPMSFLVFTCPPTFWTWYVYATNIQRWVGPGSQPTLLFTSTAKCSGSTST